MKIVADTNIFLSVVFEEPEKEKIIALTLGKELVAPDVLPFEIGNALSALVKWNKLLKKEALAAWRACLEIPVELRRVDIKKALKIACENNIYAYDAYFLLSALSLRCPLLTLDRRLKFLAQECGVTILE